MSLLFLPLLVLGLLTVLGVDWQCWPVLHYMIRALADYSVLHNH